MHKDAEYLLRLVLLVGVVTVSCGNLAVGFAVLVEDSNAQVAGRIGRRNSYVMTNLVTSAIGLRER